MSKEKISKMHGADLGGSNQKMAWNEPGGSGPKDPWGNNYTYTSPGEHGDYDLVSYGADSVEGGENNNKDIVSWK